MGATSAKTNSALPYPEWERVKHCKSKSAYNLTSEWLIFLRKFTKI
jgi:hypothetical protein